MCVNLSAKITFRAILFAGFVGISTNVNAAPSLQDILLEKGVINQQDLRSIQNGSRSLEKILLEKGLISQTDLSEITESKSSQVLDSPPVASEKKDDEYSIETGVKGLTIKSKDGDFKFGVGGRMQADANFFFPNKPYGNGAEIRRVRLKGYGTVWKDWDYKVEIDFAEEAELTDGWLSYKGFDPFRIKVGHQKVPFGMQSASSSNWQVFQERALTDSFIDTGELGRRRLGVVGSWYGGDFFTVHTGIFGQSVNDDGAFNQSWGAASRVTWSPIVGKDELLHFGGSAYYRDFNDHNGLRFRARPEAHISGVRLADTGTLSNADDLIMANAEFSSVWGPFHAQGEFVSATVNQSNGFKDLHFDGWYFQTGYFLTGESRNYNKKSAQFKRIKPSSVVGQGGWGAWEIAARYSLIDLTSQGLQGGRERNFTFGLNWWANQNVLFRFNYVNAYAHPSSIRTLGGKNQSVNILEGRAQIVF